ALLFQKHHSGCVAGAHWQTAGFRLRQLLTVQAPVADSTAGPELPVAETELRPAQLELFLTDAEVQPVFAATAQGSDWKCFQAGAGVAALHSGFGADSGFH